VPSTGANVSESSLALEVMDSAREFSHCSYDTFAQALITTPNNNKTEVAIAGNRVETAASVSFVSMQVTPESVDYSTYQATMSTLNVTTEPKTEPLYFELLDMHQDTKNCYDINTLCLTISWTLLIAYFVRIGLLASQLLTTRPDVVCRRWPGFCIDMALFHANMVLNTFRLILSVPMLFQRSIIKALDTMTKALLLAILAMQRASDSLSADLARCCAWQSHKLALLESIITELQTEKESHVADMERLEQELQVQAVLRAIEAKRQARIRAEAKRKADMERAERNRVARLQAEEKRRQDAIKAEVKRQEQLVFAAEKRRQDAIKAEAKRQQDLIKAEAKRQQDLINAEVKRQQDMINAEVKRQQQIIDDARRVEAKKKADAKRLRQQQIAEVKLQEELKAKRKRDEAQAEMRRQQQQAAKAKRQQELIQAAETKRRQQAIEAQRRQQEAAQATRQAPVAQAPVIYGLRQDGEPCQNCIKQGRYCHQHKNQAPALPAFLADCLVEQQPPIQPFMDSAKMDSRVSDALLRNATASST
jgi:hypothetical protein